MKAFVDISYHLLSEKHININIYGIELIVISDRIAISLFSTNPASR